jgi:STE24 endopeptidase
VRTGERRAALVWLVLTTGALVVVAAVVVPWDWTPGASMPTVDPTAGLRPGTLERITAYDSRATALGLAATGVGLLVSLLLGLTSWGSRLVALLPGRRRWPFQVLLAVLVLALIGRVATLPFAVPAEQLRRRYGLSTQDWGTYTLDRLRDLLVTVIVSTLVMLVVVGLARGARRGWWLIVSLLAGGLVVAGSFVYPLVVEPLYNEFTPMPEGPLRSSLITLADEDGLRVDEVLVADASRRTTAVNAYVSGFGATKRIVVYDTLLDSTPRAQVRQVVAHELGHAKDNDVATGTALGALGAMAGVTLLVLVATSAPVRRRAGIGNLGEATAVPLLLALVAVGSLLSLPAQNLVSRALEARADRHSLELTDDPATLVALQQRLATRNLNNPSPPRWEYLWFASHPTAAQRVALADVWASS